MGIRMASVAVADPRIAPRHLRCPSVRGGGARHRVGGTRVVYIAYQVSLLARVALDRIRSLLAPTGMFRHKGLLEWRGAETRVRINGLCLAALSAQPRASRSFAWRRLPDSIATNEEAMVTSVEWVERVERCEWIGLNVEKFARREGYKPISLLRR
ncbi:hypothetical protein [Sorangium sp. So ce128]|uniref:hypothetical protein n=1 Tax=Sorangium sp. So ce128 TaxID=3133281 RepID=UPI003F5EF7B2